MLVRDRLTAPVVTVTPENSLTAALTLMRERAIRRLPVVDGGTVVGIVTRTDLMRALPSPATTLSRWEIPALLARAQVREIMTHPVHVIAPDVPLEEAATLLRDHKIGALPVVQGGVLVGIITESDVFDASISLLGARLPSYRITIDIDDRDSALPDITAAVRMLGLRLHSLASYPGAPGRLRVVLRVERTRPLVAVTQGLSEHGLRVVHAAGEVAPGRVEAVRGPGR